MTKSTFQARIKPEIFVNFRPEPDPKTPGRLTTLQGDGAQPTFYTLRGNIDIMRFDYSFQIHTIRYDHYYYYYKGDFKTHYKTTK